MRFTEKSNFKEGEEGGRVHEKPIYRGDYLKKESWIVEDLNGGLGKKEW